MSDEASTPAPNRAPRAILSAFPRAGRRLEHAYAELDVAAGGGTQQQRNALGDARLLARPWDPATCLDPQLRTEIWQWLEKVVTWLNHEYAWDADVVIPSCWPRHPHLVHELAVTADLRRRASLALTADALEEWHRYALPAFIERMGQRLRQHCQDGGHQPWPAGGRHTRHLGDGALRDRTLAYRADAETLRNPPGVAISSSDPRRRNLWIIDGLRADLDSRENLD